MLAVVVAGYGVLALGVVMVFFGHRRAEMLMGYGLVLVALGAIYMGSR